MLALRILVDTEQDCYLSLGIIHSKFRPLPKRFKDYIAMPKPNMYQSLHTTVFGIDGYLFEIQIRTYQMDEVAENGIASHWAYKEHKDASKLMQNTTEQKLQFFKTIIELSQDKMTSEDFVNSVKDEVLNNNIYVFTPKGDVMELPKGATPLDFAYKVHSKVGETTVGAIVNGQIVPLDYQLQNNDIVKINTNKNGHPSKEWLNIVKSTQARNKIRSYFTKSEKELFIERGKYSLEKELRKKKYSIQEFMKEENINTVLETLKIGNLDELYLEIGNGKYSPTTVIRIIYKEEEPTEQVEVKTKKIEKETSSDIIVAGIDNIKVSLASCCDPVYGDSIVGYITKGNGISIHRATCPNLLRMDDRLVSVNWSSNPASKYSVDLVIYSNTSDNNIADIIATTSKIDANINGVKIIDRGNNTVYEMQCFVRNLEHLEKVLLELNKKPYINNIERLMQ